MKLIRAIPGILLIGTRVLSCQPLLHVAIDPDKVYRDLASRLREGDLSIDFQTLRFACSEASECEVRGNVTDLRAIAEALKQGDFVTARQVCEKVLTRGYADIEIHADLVSIYLKLGDRQRSDFHRAVVAAMLRSILATSGTTEETALRVISTREIYSTMAAMGLPYFGSGASEQPFEDGGHRYVLMLARDPKTSQTKRVYFNLDHLDSEKGKTDRP